MGGLFMFEPGMRVQILAGGRKGQQGVIVRSRLSINKSSSGGWRDLQLWVVQFEDGDIAVFAESFLKPFYMENHQAV
jgi:hypothetical protein